MDAREKAFFGVPVEVELGGARFPLHRLNRPDVFELGESLIRAWQELGEDRTVFSVLRVLREGDALDRLFALSVPDFRDWKELPFVEELRLFGTIWRENDVPGIIETFKELAEILGASLSQRI